MAFASGKVILFGEHAVVYGRTAVAAAIDRGVNASAIRAERFSLTVNPPGLRVVTDAGGNGQTVEGSDPRRVHALAAAFTELAAWHPNHAYDVSASVELPLGGGLGSSAALGVAVVRALDEAEGIARSAAGERELADAWERHFHGKPSGLDVATCVHGGVIRFRKGGLPEPVTLERSLQLVVAFDGQTASTRAMVDKVAARRNAAPDATERLFDQIEQCAHEGLSALARGDHAALGRAFTANHTLLVDLGVSTPALDALIGCAQAAGALGAKLTGAGGGGCVIALARDAEQSAAMLEALRGVAAEAFATEVRT